MWRPPKAAAMIQSFHVDGVNTARVPASMKQIPITGTIFTENAPPATTAVPYSRSHMPGITPTSPARKSTMVRRAPTRIGGEKLRTNFRPGPESRGMRALRAFRTIPHNITAGARTAAAIQTYSDWRTDDCADAVVAAPVAMMPTATIAHPDTAVNETAAAIVSRMKARLSIARAWSAGGSVAVARCKGVTEAMMRT